ncbi:dynamin family protein [Cetobacterium sp. SF1]|uniref:dynamin family protein n=1 Tax=Cetobacterium sp. SF1 TaxID=3417654 RepID=UPI003CECC6CF
MIKKKKKNTNGRNGNISIAVIATMSSGKSTLINALIGNDILPSENQACTGKIFKIVNNNKNILEIKEGLENIKKEIEYDTLRELNEKEEVEEIKIETSFKELKKKIILYDTPGVNNYLNKNHGDITYNFLRNNSIDKIIYVMNASQLGVNDDKEFLLNIKEIYKNKPLQILFALNKIDVLDGEKEDREKIIEDTKEYIKNIGFKNPKIIPLSAHMGKILRKGFDEKLETRREKMEYKNYLEYFSEDDRELSREEIMKKTGIIEIEKFINKTWGNRNGSKKK